MLQQQVKDERAALVNRSLGEGERTRSIPTDPTCRVSVRLGSRLMGHRSRFADSKYAERLKVLASEAADFHQ